MTGPVTVVVGADGSEASGAALAWSAGLVGALGGQVVAVHALGLLSHLPPGGEGPPEAQAAGTGGSEAPRAGGVAPEGRGPAARGPDHRAQAEASLHRWCAPLQAAGVVHRCVVADGNPVIALLHVARDVGADLIVVGRRGSGGFPGLLLGSTSHELTAHAHTPVVVVPGPATAAP